MTDLDRDLALEAVRVTEAAAVAAASLMGRGDEKAADQVAVDAMRRELNRLPIDGTVVIGEGERDEAPMLYIGEKVGTGKGPKVDIALDPVPRTGGATTTDALWMGVPVVTLAGKRMIERQGASLLSAVGFDELIAKNPNDYVAKAVALAQDPERRKTLRAELRERMAASELCDGRGLATALEDAYREMWVKYVKRET